MDAVTLSGAPLVRGVVGIVKWSYYNAAAINGYTVRRAKPRSGEWTLQATVVQHDAFKLKQRPLVFVAPHAKGEWRWPIVDMNFQGGILTARLGPPETYAHG